MLRMQTDTVGIDWQQVKELLQSVEMSTHPAEMQQIAFENSYKVVFFFAGQRLVAMGRMLSDGVYQGALYDVAVANDYQGQGLGKQVVQSLMQGEDDKVIIFYATPGKEGFYQHLGFERMRTGMCRFPDWQAGKKRGFF